MINVVDVDNTVARLSEKINDSSRIETNIQLGGDNFKKYTPMKEFDLDIPKFNTTATLSDI